MSGLSLSWNINVAADITVAVNYCCHSLVMLLLGTVV